MNNNNSFEYLQAQIEAAEKKGEPVDGYVKQQINLLKASHEEFVKTAQEHGYELNNQKLGEIEVRQYSAMKQLAQKIGLPVEEYDSLIKEVRIRIFGEENYTRFFEEQ